MSDPLDQLFEGLPKHLTVEQLADVLGVPRTTAYKWLSRRAIPAYKIEASWLILRDEVKQHLRAQRNTGAGDTSSPPSPEREQARPEDESGGARTVQ